MMGSGFGVAVVEVIIKVNMGVLVDVLPGEFGVPFFCNLVEFFFVEFYAVLVVDSDLGVGEEDFGAGEVQGDEGRVEVDGGRAEDLESFDVVFVVFVGW